MVGRSLQINVLAGALEGNSLFPGIGNDVVADAGDGLIAAVVKDAESLFFRQVFHVFALTVGGNGNTVGNEVRVVQRIGNKKHSLGGVGTVLPQGSGNDTAEVFLPVFHGIGTQGFAENSLRRNGHGLDFKVIFTFYTFF